MGISGSMRSAPKGETLSAFMDGEVSQWQAGSVVRDLEDDPHLQQLWQRYHLISDALRNSLPVALELNLAQRVSSALRSEPLPIVSRQLSFHPPAWVRHAAGFAIAASVTAVTIIAVQSFYGSEPASSPQVAVVDTTSTGVQRQAQTSVVSVVGNRWNPDRPALEAKLNDFLLNHNEYVAGTAMPLAVPYARIVSYGGGE